MFWNLNLLRKNTVKIFLLLLNFPVLNSPAVSQCLHSTRIYYNDFDAGSAPGWSSNNSIVFPSSYDSLGPFGAETLSFKSQGLVSLPCHDSVKVSFKLILSGSWDGNGDHCCGPDIFLIKANGAAIYETTFSNADNNHQSYPDQYHPTPNTINNAPYTGSAHNNNVDWSVYYISVTFPDTSQNIVIDIAQPSSQGIDDEAWYLDDFSLDVCRSFDIPLMQVTPAAIICTGDSILLTAKGALTYSWSPADGLNSTTGDSVKAGPSSTTTYTVTATTTHCPVVASTTVTIKQKSFSNTHQAICAGQSYLGHSAAGIYADTLAAANGCDSIRTLYLEINPKSAEIINKTICLGQSYLGHTTTGVYIDTLFARGGCDSTRTINLTVLEKPVPSLGMDKELCMGDSLSLFPGNFDTYLWQDHTTSSHFVVRQPGLYAVTVANSCGSGHDEVLVSSKSCNISFPNAFTPNRDGKNDAFKILAASSLTDYQLVIYNCWGQKIFETKDYTQGWDGTFCGKPQYPGVYVYYCKYKKATSVVETKGNVILMR